MSRTSIPVLSLILIAVLALAACGEAPTATPLPTNTPAPTDTPAPTRTPAPTVDTASLPLADLQATATALEEKLAYAHSAAEVASSAAEENAAAQDISRYENQIAQINELIASAGGGASEELTLTLVGAIDEARDWDWAEIEAVGTKTATVAGPRDSDPEAEYTGVGLAAFLEAAGLGEDAATLKATAADGFNVEIDLAAVKDCEDCMLVLVEDGGLRLVMPGFASREWVQDLVSLEAK